MNFIKSLLNGIVVIVGSIALIGSLPKCSAPATTTETSALVSRGDCLLPNIHGEAQYFDIEKHGEFCVLNVLKGQWRSDYSIALNKSCRLTSYNVVGKISKHDFLTDDRLLHRVKQEEEVCRVYMPWNEWQYLNNRMAKSTKPILPLIEGATVEIEYTSSQAQFTATVPGLYVNKSDLQQMQSQLVAEARAYVEYYQAGNLELVLKIKGSTSLKLYDYPPICAGVGYAAPIVWKCDEQGQEVSANVEATVLGMTPAERKAIYEEMSMLAVMDVWTKNPGRRYDAIVSAIRTVGPSMQLNVKREKQLLNKFDLNAQQLAYIRSEGLAAGWYEEQLEYYRRNRP